MNLIQATVQNGRIDVPAPTDLPDGTKVLVGIAPVSPEKIGIEESEWRDDPAANADWNSWFKSIEPIEWNEGHPFDEKFRSFNIEAVRKQMDEARA